MIEAGHRQVEKDSKVTPMTGFIASMESVCLCVEVNRQYFELASPAHLL